jgi:cytochrome b involved in lipid metabolism
MYDWFWELSRAWAGYSPRKARMWQAIHDGFDRGLGIPKWAAALRRLPEHYAMDKSFRAAIGLRTPLAVEVAGLRQVLKVIASTRRQLPVGPWVLSLHNFYSLPNGAPVERLGDQERSPRMPAACPFSGKTLPNKGYPADQLPLPAIETAAEIKLETFSWDEVKKHATPDDLWVVFGGYVYDVSSFARNHPGGLKVLLNGVGRDLSRAFEAAGHSDPTKVFTLNFRIGKIESVALEADQSSLDRRISSSSETTIVTATVQNRA